MSAMAQSATPIEDVMRAKVRRFCVTDYEVLLMKSKIAETLKPSRLEVYNDSYMHSHHKAMQGNSSRETHFRYSFASTPINGILICVAPD